MCLMLPISDNYLHGWHKTEMSLEALENRVSAPGGTTLSEIMEPEEMIKPYADIDLKVNTADFQREDARMQAYWTEQLAPLCPSPDDLAISTRSIRDFDTKGKSKVSYHFILNGLKCRANLVGTFLRRFLGQDGFDDSAFIRKDGKRRVFTMVNTYKPQKQGGHGTAKMMPLSHIDDLSKHLVHYSEEADLDSAVDVTPAAPTAPAVAAQANKRKQPEQPGAQPPAQGGLAPPDDIMLWIKHNWKVTSITPKEADRQVKKKHGRSEVLETEFRNVWYVQIGHECPIQKERGITVCHENHVYIDVFESYQNEEDRHTGLRGEVSLVQIRCMHSGSVHRECTRPVDKTKPAKAWAASVRQCEQWNKRVCYIESTGSFYYEAHGKAPVPYKDASRVQMTMANQSDMKVHDWLAHPTRRSYHEANFYPSLDPAQLPKRFVDGTDMNLFQGYAITKQTASPGNIEPLLDHIKNIWCNGDAVSYEYTLNWMARVVQKPWQRTRIVLVLISKEGVGKGMVTDILGEILGSQCFLSESRKDNLFGQFNSSLSCKTLVVMNELLWAGSHEASGVFKDMITDKAITVNEKHQVQRQEDCYQNYAICTQGPWAVPASCESRRFFVLEPSDRYCGNQDQESTQYFNRLATVQPKHVADFLYKRDISSFIASQVPETKALTGQKLESLTPVQSVLYEALIEGHVFCIDSGGWDKMGNPYQTTGHFGASLQRSQILEGMTQASAQMRCDKHHVPQKFWRQLKSACTAKGETILHDQGRVRNSSSGVRAHYMRFSPLDECRAFWEKHCFVPPGGWPQETDENLVTPESANFDVFESADPTKSP